jgi:hypothetical protein
MRLEIELAQDETAALIKQAVEERRPADWQAEVLLRRALGLGSECGVVHSPGTPHKESEGGGGVEPWT